MQTTTLPTLESKIQELVTLFKEFREWSRKANGWDTKRYGDNMKYVRCYFADDSQHTHVKFSNHGSDFGVGFFNPPQVEAHLPLLNIDALSHVIEDVKGILSAEKLIAETISDEERKAKQADRIKALETQLARLKGEEVTIENDDLPF